MHHATHVFQVNLLVVLSSPAFSFSFFSVSLASHTLTPILLPGSHRIKWRRPPPFGPVKTLKPRFEIKRVVSFPLVKRFGCAVLVFHSLVLRRRLYRGLYDDRWARFTFSFSCFSPILLPPLNVTVACRLVQVCHHTVISLGKSLFCFFVVYEAVSLRLTMQGRRDRTTKSSRSEIEPAISCLFSFRLDDCTAALDAHPDSLGNERSKRELEGGTE